MHAVRHPSQLPALPPGRFHGNHAIVIGASISGLLAARVLSAHFDRVTVYDRDALPSAIENRRAVPQGYHGHGLLASGLRGLKTLFPSIDRDLLYAGAVPGDVIGNIRWHQHGHYKAKFASGLEGLLLSRPLLRRYTAAASPAAAERTDHRQHACEGPPRRARHRPGHWPAARRPGADERCGRSRRRCQR